MTTISSTQSSARYSITGNVRVFSRSLMLALALMSPMAITGCRTPSFDPRISTQQEDKVGDWASAQLAGQYQDPPSVVASLRVSDISRRLLNVMDQANPPSIHVTLLQEELPEAFSLPGGWVYITSGLADHLPSDDALAAVIAHEIGHAAYHHAAQELVATLGKDTVVDMLTQGKYDDLANISLQLTHFSHSRNEEAEADAFGLAVTARAGYAPRGLADAVAALQTIAPPQTAAWAHVHPMDKSRAERLKRLVSLDPPPARTGTKIETNH